MNNLPTRNRNAVLALELVPGLFGVFGIGWLFAGFSTIGILLIVASLLIYAVSCVVLSLSAGIGLFCVIPLHILITGVSAWKLHLRMQDDRHRFY